MGAGKAHTRVLVAAWLLLLVCCSAENDSCSCNGPVPYAGGGAGCHCEDGSGSGAGQQPPADGSATDLDGSGARGDGGYAAVDAGLEHCAVAVVTAEPATVTEEQEEEVTVSDPVALYIMLDRSDRMSVDNWAAAVYGINGFLGDTRSENINLALQYFPVGDDTSCSGRMYASPEVSLGRLPDNARAVTRSLSQTFTGGGRTNMTGALRGLADFCRKYQESERRNPEGESCAGILISGGSPNVCLVQSEDLARIASKAFVEHGVMTFTIGMPGANIYGLNLIADEGGTDCDPRDDAFACEISRDQTVDGALRAIRDSLTSARNITRTRTITRASDCEWLLPAPAAGETLDLERLNLRFSADGQEPEWIGRVPARDECGDAAGWYYDDSAEPATIAACPRTCETVLGSTGATIEIVLGCPAIVAADQAG